MANYCSPLVATGSGATLGFVEEACFGVIPTAPIVKTVRRRSTSLGLKKENYISEEVRSDRQIVSSRHGTRSVDGDIVTEISSGAHEAFYEALLGGNWQQVAAPGISVATVPFTQSISTGVITFTPLTADPAVVKARIGDIVRFTATTQAYFDNNLFQIVNLTATTMAIVALKTPTLPLPTSPMAAGTCRPQPRVDMGNIYRSFTFERAFEDIGSFITYKGCKFNTAAIDLPASGIATCTFGVMGQDANPLSASSIDGSAALVLTDTTYGVITGDAATKTLTATTGDFTTSGLVVGDQIILDGGGGASFQNRALRTITKITALVLTVAEAVRTGPTTTAWTLTRLSNIAYDAPAQNNVLVAATGVVVFDGIPVATITALTINIDNKMASSAVVGSVITPAILWGNNCDVGGSMTILFDRGGAGEAAYNAFVNETDNIRIIASLVNAEGTRCVGFVMNRCKINTGDIGDAVAEGLPVTVEFVALKPTANVTYTGDSQITVIDTEVTSPAPATFAVAPAPVAAAASKTSFKVKDPVIAAEVEPA